VDFLGLGVGPLEIAFILLIAFLLFGPDKLPEIARGAGKAVRELKKYSSGLTGDLKAEFEKELNATTNTPPNKPQATGETLNSSDITSQKTDTPSNKPQATGETLNSPNITFQKTEEVKPPNPNE
jgi:TatA/E family protein of Tat protein translocase